jgi:hypothetical protein
MTPRQLGILTCEGRIRSYDPIAKYNDPAVLACANALAAARSTISEDEKIGQSLSLPSMRPRSRRSSPPEAQLNSVIGDSSALQGRVKKARHFSSTSREKAA